MRILLFARARDLAGADQIELAVPVGTTVSQLRAVLLIRCPALGPLLTRSALALNGEFAEESAIVPADAEVALLPPVSGG